MKYRIIGYGTIASILMLGIAGFLIYFVIQVIIENKSLKSILDDFVWKESNSFWQQFSKANGVLMTSEYSIASFSDSINQITLEHSSQSWLNNFVFDRVVDLTDAYFSSDKDQILANYEIKNDLVDITGEEVKVLNPSVLRYLQEIEKTSLSNLSVYLLARLFQDRTENLSLLRQSYATEKILLNQSFELTHLQMILNKKFDYNTVNFVKLFLDEQFGLFNDVGLYYWLKVLDHHENQDFYNYNFYRTKLQIFLEPYNTVNVSDLIDFVLFGKDNEINLLTLFNQVKGDYVTKIKGLCGDSPCTDKQLNLLQWGQNIFNKFLSDEGKDSHSLSCKFYLISKLIKSFKN